MPSVLDATPGSPTANAFCTLVEARAFYADHLYGATAALADDATLTQAILMATRLINVTYVWYGFSATNTQALSWPRYLMENPNQARTWMDSFTIPQRLKEATAELARLLMVTDRTAEDDVQVKGIGRLAVPGADITFTGRGGRQVIPPSVDELINVWGYKRGGGGTRRLVRA